MDLHQRLQLSAKLAATFEYKKMILPKGEASDYYSKHDQSHLLHFWDSISGEDQTKLAAQVRTQFPVDVASANLVQTSGAMGVTNIFFESVKHSATLPARFEAPDAAKDMIDVEKISPEELAQLEKQGIDVLASGRGAVCVLAGGSGTRLGVSFPKGMLVCPDTVAPRSLFQWHAERVLALQTAFAAKKPIPFVVMLSPQNEDATKEFFHKHAFFGLSESQVYFFTQSVMPCFNPNGKIILATEGSIANAPGGNAGIYPAMYQSGVLTKLRDAGVELIQIVTVDNLLVSVADPILFGSAVIKNPSGSSNGGHNNDSYIDVVAKATPKLHDNEAVGVFARRVYPSDFDPQNAALRWGCLEYSEVGSELAAKKRSGTDDRLFNAANIAVHLFSADFVERAAEHMLSDFTYYHVAKKPVPTSIPLDKRAQLYGGEEYLQGASWGGGATETSTPAIKLEAFIFDLFQYANSFKLLQVVRSEEFSAIKNADDSNMVKSSFHVITDHNSQQQHHEFSSSGVKKDSPQTAVKDLHMLHAKWLIHFCNKNNNASSSNVQKLSELIERNQIRVEFSPRFVPRASVLEQKREEILKQLESGEQVVQQVEEFCANGKSSVIVIFGDDEGRLKVNDMSLVVHGTNSSNL